MLADFAEVVQGGTRDEMLLAAIDWERLPRHVAIIMDGNGRWAAGRGQPRIAGHRAGVEAVRASVDTGARLGLGALTLYAFSTENWKRPRRRAPPDRGGRKPRSAHGRENRARALHV